MRNALYTLGIIASVGSTLTLVDGIWPQQKAEPIKVLPTYEFTCTDLPGVKLILHSYGLDTLSLWKGCTRVK